MLAQLLSDNSHFPLRVSIFDGETKALIFSLYVNLEMTVY